jgi:hypothetical protein
MSAILSWRMPQDPASIIERGLDFTGPLGGDSIASVVSVTESTGQMVISGIAIGANAAGLAAQVVEFTAGPTPLLAGYPSMQSTISAVVTTVTRGETLRLSGVLKISPT